MKNTKKVAVVPEVKNEEKPLTREKQIADFQERGEKATAEVNAILEKYQVTIRGFIDIKPEGIFPIVQFADMKYVSK